MSDRNPLSKKTRFEVFKRDSFTCQYCGKSAPDVVLEVDHIKPVSEGGTDDMLNLVTACFDCNRGKGKGELSDDSVIKRQKSQLDMLAERREQIEMMYEWQLALVDENEYQVNKIIDLIKELTIWIPNDAVRPDIAEWLSNYGFGVVSKAVRIAFSKYEHEELRDFLYAFGKINGICYNLTHKLCGQCTHNDGYSTYYHKVRCDIDPESGYAYKNSYAECCKYYNPWFGGVANA